MFRVERNGSAVWTMAASGKRVEELASDLAFAIERFRLRAMATHTR